MFIPDKPDDDQASTPIRSSTLKLKNYESDISPSVHSRQSVGLDSKKL